MSLATPARLTRESSQGPSPAYSAGRRYSLYGSEDRVVLDLGSKLWKYGFSSDSAPRGVVDVSTWGGPDAGLWDQDCSKWTDEQEKQVQAVVQRGLRQIVYRALMLDPRQRKMVITEGPLLPLRIKNMIARVLFDNLQVCTSSIRCSPLK
jgi:actin-related protein 10